MSNDFEEKTIKSWEEFCGICEKECQNNGITIFRGEKDAGYKELLPSLPREINGREIPPQNIYDIEEELIDAFIRKYFPESMKWLIKVDLFSRMFFLMQHYGMKTRMLDWTYFWPVAAAFAVRGKNSKDAAVWCINKTKIESKLRGYCKKYEERRNYHLKLKSNEMCWDDPNPNGCPAKQNCSGRILCNAIFFREALPISIDVRMITQGSVFTYCMRPFLDQKECITKVLGEDADTHCKKIIIPEKLKPEFRRQLNEQLKTLFPTIKQRDNKKMFEDIMRKYQDN